MAYTKLRPQFREQSLLIETISLLENKRYIARAYIIDFEEQWELLN